MQNITSGLFWAKKSVFSWQIIEFLNDLLEGFDLLDLLEGYEKSLFARFSLCSSNMSMSLLV